MRAGFAAALLVLLSVTMVAEAHAPSSSSAELLVQTPYGPVQGVLGGGVRPTRAFLGIPFAIPPVGPLRFRPAQAAAPWGPSVLSATSFKSACIQPPGYVSVPISEDCLYLNIWTPLEVGDFLRCASLCARSLDCCMIKQAFASCPLRRDPRGQATASSRLPVMVWIHGGSFVDGSGASFNGTRLAGQGNTVVVTINYRMVIHRC